MPRDLPCFVVKAGVVGGLTAARLVERHVHFHAAALEHPHDRHADVGVDFENLLAEEARGAGRSGGHGLADGTVIGHVHLHVSRLADAERFYVGVLGFDLTQRYGPSALFVSAGGYHHHVGLNTWAGVGAPPPPPGALGLHHYVVTLPDETALAAVAARVRAANLPVESLDGGLLVHDPAKNAILLAVR